MKHILLFIVILSIFSLTHSSTKLKLGTPESILSECNKENVRSLKVYTFYTSTAEEIKAEVEDFYFQNGQLSMVGRALGSENSSFLLKGDKKKIYGWIALKDKDVAYEYTTTERGNVIVEKVPVSKVVTVCDIHPPKGTNVDVVLDHAYSRLARRQAPHIGEYDNEDLMELESFPGCDKVFYMDITRIMNNGDPITLNSKTEMWKNWQSVASSLSMYQLNVTTSRSVYDEAGVPNSGIATFLNQSGRSNADVNSFGTTRTSRNYINSGQGYGLGRTAAHEIGHQMGLSHDRGNNGSQEYYTGLSEYKWVPIMGNYWSGNRWGDNALYQYSKGEYEGGSNHEDDFEEMGEYVIYREDDIPATVPLKFSGTTVSPDDNFGQITENTDSDGFTFAIGPGGGHINLAIERIEYIGGGMLDINALLKDASGSVIEEDNPKAVRSAEFNLDLDAGEYTLEIEGGAEGTPQDGFPIYSSVGFYAIEGEITGGVTGIADHKKLTKSIFMHPIIVGAFLNLNIPKDIAVDKITLYSIKGAVVYNSQKRVNAINLSDYAAGLYVLNVVARDGSKLVKNIVKK